MWVPTDHWGPEERQSSSTASLGRCSGLTQTREFGGQSWVAWFCLPLLSIHLCGRNWDGLRNPLPGSLLPRNSVHSTVNPVGSSLFSHAFIYCLVPVYSWFFSWLVWDFWPVCWEEARRIWRFLRQSGLPSSQSLQLSLSSCSLHHLSHPFTNIGMLVVFLFYCYYCLWVLFLLC